MDKMTISVDLNSPSAIEARIAKKRIPRLAPFLILLARPGLAILAQGIFILVFIQGGVPAPTTAVRHWWTVYGTFIDLGCLGILFWLTRHEGIRLFDLLSFDKTKIKKDILIGVGIFLVVFPLSVFSGGLVGGWLAYGSLNPTFPDGGFIRVLPLWAVWFSRIFWWPLWSLTEELTFQGYALPRLQALTRSTWLSVALVSCDWSLQHSFLPWIDPRHALYLFITFIPLTIAMQLIYLRVRRLPPLIVGHWLMDFVSVLFMVQVG